MLCSIKILQVYIKTTCICTCDVSEVKLLLNTVCFKLTYRVLKVNFDILTLVHTYVCKYVLVLCTFKNFITD